MNGSKTKRIKWRIYNESLEFFSKAVATQGTKVDINFNFEGVHVCAFIFVPFDVCFRLFFIYLICMISISEHEHSG